MSAPSIPYKRVPGLGSGLFQTSRLYFGPDHLLLVGAAGWNESYRRFYFRDIQALIIRPSHWGKIQSVIWALLIFLFAAIALESSDGGAITGWIFTGLFALGLVINVLRGPTCACQIQTAVQTTGLSSLGRVKRAQKFLVQLKSIIEEVQGTTTATPAVHAAFQPAATQPPVETAPPTAGP